MRLLGWTQIQSYWCHYEKRKFGHRDTWEMQMHTQRRDHVIFKPSREASEETKYVDTLILDFRPPEKWKTRFLLFKLSSLWHFDGSPSRLIQLSDILSWEKQSHIYLFIFYNYLSLLRINVWLCTVVLSPIPSWVA